MRQDLDDDRPARLARCLGCGSRKDRCPCDAQTDAWLKANAPSEALPDAKDAGRVGGGHDRERPKKGRRGGQQLLADLARAMGVEVHRAGRRGQVIEASAPAGHALRHYRDWIVARLTALDTAHAEERGRLELHERIISMLFDGDGMDQSEIGEVLGHGRQWVSRKVTELRAEASGLRVVSSLLPRCPRCGAEIRPHERGGRRRVWCSRRCKKAAYKARHRVRKGVRNARKRRGARPGERGSRAA